jgi:hypothetical protein
VSSTTDLIDLLVKHRYAVGQRFRVMCSCGEPDPCGRRGNRAEAHRAHVAAVLAEHLTAARREALREAADVVARNRAGMGDPTEPYAPYDRGFEDFLRDRADKIEAASSPQLLGEGA